MDNYFNYNKHYNKHISYIVLNIFFFHFEFYISHNIYRTLIFLKITILFFGIIKNFCNNIYNFSNFNIYFLLCEKFFFLYLSFDKKKHEIYITFYLYQLLIK